MHRSNRRGRVFETAPQPSIRRRTKRLHGVANWSVACAATQVSTKVTRIKSVAARAKLLREHADDEPRRTIAALRSAALSHRTLHLAKHPRFRESFDSVDLASGCGND